MPVEADQQMADEPVTGAAAGGVIGGAVGATLGGPVGLAAGMAAGGALGAVVGKSVTGGEVEPETKDTEAREAGKYVVIVHAGERATDARSLLAQANANVEPPEEAPGQAP
jgi:outer membrane lipoprotein SlyB